MEGKKGSEDAEAHEHQWEDEPLCLCGDTRRHDVDHVKGAHPQRRGEIDGHHGDEDEGGSAHQHEGKFVGAILFPPAAPDADQQEFRDDRDLEEEEHREEVE